MRWNKFIKTESSPIPMSSVNSASCKLLPLGLLTSIKYIVIIRQMRYVVNISEKKNEFNAEMIPLVNSMWNVNSNTNRITIHPSPSGMRTKGQWDCSAGEPPPNLITWVQSPRPQYGNREQAPTGCPLTPELMPWHVHAHTQRNKCN